MEPAMMFLFLALFAQFIFCEVMVLALCRIAAKSDETMRKYYETANKDTVL